MALYTISRFGVAHEKKLVTKQLGIMFKLLVSLNYVHQL